MSRILRACAAAICGEGTLPVPHPAGIDVDEIGLGVVADPAFFNGCGGFAKFGQRDAGQSDVHGLSHHVQALFGDTVGAALECTIGGRGPISGDDLKGRINGHFVAHGMENVQQVGVDDFNFVGPVVSQQVIDLLQRFALVRPLIPVNGLVKMFAGMGIVKRQGAFRRGGYFCQGWPWNKHGAGGRQAQF